jgi:hypothetical protein
MKRDDCFKLLTILSSLVLIASYSSWITLNYVGFQMDSAPFWDRQGELWATRLTWLHDFMMYSTFVSLTFFIACSYFWLKNVTFKGVD